ncbi:MAG: polysaccharide pyruvyl transferase family protein [Burkholderiales bacterium]|nr:polysaccharide pyruvyl transferase family protein [Burkholderiales bacterium]
MNCRNGCKPSWELVVGASAMGNVGDDLLAEVLGGLLRIEASARVWWSGPDVSLAQLRQFDAVVVGGGGLIYASRDGRDESQNLANYLKFGPMARAAGLPVALIGVSDQDHAGGVASGALSTMFARRCLQDFTLGTTRDEHSSQFLAQLGLARVATGPDLLFAWTARARKAIHAAAPQPARLAMAGEWLDCAPMVAALQDPAHPLAQALAGQEIDLLLMSDDDRRHADRLRQWLPALGATASIQDLRGRPFDALVHAFSQYRGLITTRFHGLVLALLSDIPVLAWDHPDGKKSRLLQALDATELLLTPEDTAQRFGERMVAAVRTALPTARAAGVNRQYAQCRVHREALRELLRPWTAESTTSRDDDPGDDVPTIGPRPPGPLVGQRHRSDLLDGAAQDSSIGLCWAASTRETAGFGNLGDSLSAVMVCALAGRPVHHLDFSHRGSKLVAVGSIAHAIHEGEAVIWGSGVSIRGGILAHNVPRTAYDVRAVRGPISARHLQDFGIPVPEVYGDPVWLLPSIFNEPVEKRYELGVIPHIQDIAGHGPQARPPADSLRYQIPPEFAHSVTLINTWHEPSWDGIVATLRQILACKRIVSQSFHGVVIAEAYGIPVLNFRQMPGLDNGPLEVSLLKDCSTDPRIWEFFKGGPRPSFQMYAQRRDQPTDWAAVMRAVDQRWTPFDCDASALVESFPLPLAYNPITGRIAGDGLLRQLRF